MDKLPITACIITLNEEKNIQACLDSLDFVSEFVVVDSFSQDKTRELCEQRGVRFFEHPFEGHIQQKNLALSYASQPWVLALDADERVSGNMREKIFEIFHSAPQECGFRFRRRTWYISRFILHGRFYPDWQLRLFRKDSACWAGKNPHDKIELSGSCKDVKADILHYSYADVSGHVKTLNSFSSIQARNLYNENRRGFVIAKMCIKSFWAFVDSYFLRRGLLDGREGFIVACFAAVSMFVRYAKLYELTVLANKSDGGGAREWDQTVANSVEPSWEDKRRIT